MTRRTKEDAGGDLGLATLDIPFWNVTVIL
jgi:hypothetical protein